MKNKIFLITILLTPIFVLTLSSLYFVLGYSPENTRNNGDFFYSYFSFDQFKTDSGKKNIINFEDGKWVMAVYITDPEKSAESLYLMKQLNVALNRDIYKVKRIAFYSNKLIENKIRILLNEYPRTSLINDENGVLLNVLQKNSKSDFVLNNPIFIIDPYGRAVMYFSSELDPKLILKDLKVLI